MISQNSCQEWLSNTEETNEVVEAWKAWFREEHWKVTFTYNQETRTWLAEGEEITWR